MIAALGLFAACNNQEQEPGTAARRDSKLPVVGPEPTIAATAEDDILLIWVGRPPGEGVRGDGKASFGPCDGSLMTTDFTGSQLTEIASHFASFELQGEGGLFRFRGQGEVDGPAWSSSLAAWAETVAERLDPAHIVVGYIDNNEEWGMAIVNLQGSLRIVDAEPNGSFVDILAR